MSGRLPTKAAPTGNAQERITMLAINISRDTGMPIKDLMQQLQGPVPAGAQDEKR
jgi:hypothetical protein